MTILNDRLRNVEDKQTYSQVSNNATLQDSQKPRRHEIMLLENNLKTTNEKLLSLQDQLSAVQEQMNKNLSSNSTINDHANKFLNFERQMVKVERTLDETRQHLSEISSKNRLEKLEREQENSQILKSFENSLATTVNSIQDQIHNNENNIKAQLTSRILQIEENTIDRLEGFSTAAGKIRNDIKSQFSELLSKFEERIYKLQSTVNNEKTKMGRILSQQELASKEIERIVKIGQKEFETLLFAEITKREKNTKMVHELDKSVQEICLELDTKMVHYEKRAHTTLSKMSQELKSNLALEHKTVMKQLVNHDKELTNLNDLISEKYEKLTDFCNNTYTEFDTMINNFETEMDKKFSEKSKILENLTSQVNEQHKETDVRVHSTEDKISKLEEDILPSNIERLLSDINRLKSTSRHHKSDFNELLSKVKTIENVSKLSSEKIAKKANIANDKNEVLLQKMANLEGKVSSIENLIKIDGKRVKSVWTAVVAESDTTCTNETVTEQTTGNTTATITSAPSQVTASIEVSNFDSVEQEKQVQSQITRLKSARLADIEKNDEDLICEDVNSLVNLNRQSCDTIFSLSKNIFIPDSMYLSKMQKYTFYNVMFWMKIKRKWLGLIKDVDGKRLETSERNEDSF